MMPKPDDCTLPENTALSIKKEAHNILNKADAIGCFPTPTKEIIQAAKVEIAPPDVWNIKLIAKLRKKAKDALLKAISKVLGIFDSHASIIYIDPNAHPAKMAFLELHETGHAHIPWQKGIFSLFEDCNKTLAPEVAAQFEREANVFASEVLFQGDHFQLEAQDYKFSINTPVELSKKYGASIYSSIRRYVMTNYRACVVVVLNPLKPGEEYIHLRRVVASDKFKANFSNIEWADKFHINSEIGRAIPILRKMSQPISIELQDDNGVRHECIAEGFTNTFQIFMLIYPERELTRKIFIPQGTDVEL